MKMLMIVAPENRREELRKLVDQHDVHAYSELDHVVGEGKTGKRMETAVWPSHSSLIFSVLDDAKEQELVGALRRYQATLFPDEGLHAFVLPVEAVI